MYLGYGYLQLELVYYLYGENVSILTLTIQRGKYKTLDLSHVDFMYIWIIKFEGVTTWYQSIGLNTQEPWEDFVSWGLNFCISFLMKIIFSHSLRACVTFMIITQAYCDACELMSIVLSCCPCWVGVEALTSFEIMWA